jgi:arylsulfatase A-like enzyme
MVSGGCGTSGDIDKPKSLPNIILIFCDDLGYADIGCFGSTKHRTPKIDRIAKEGKRFTNFYVTSGVCTPSRASLLTGCYPRRLNMHEDTEQHWVLLPIAKRGLNPDETTIAEILKTQGYATACIGKWISPNFCPHSKVLIIILVFHIATTWGQIDIFQINHLCHL